MALWPPRSNHTLAILAITTDEHLNPWVFESARLQAAVYHKPSHRETDRLEAKQLHMFLLFKMVLVALY